MPSEQTGQTGQTGLIEHPAARPVVERLAARPATLGKGRLLCVDGPAGSGKTTLAAAVAALVPDAQVVHTDDLLPGWSGLPLLSGRLEGLLRPLGRGGPGTFRRWDWTASDWAGTVTVPPGPLLVLEGVGSGAAAYADLRTLLVWVEAPHDLRMRRGLERDGDAFAPHWQRWAEAEAELFARERTRDRADLVVDGRDGTVREVSPPGAPPGARSSSDAPR
ncbi:MAG: 4-amino-4-deoxy-L-arabinose transferase [Marmoricola sp.]|nr:4-amino-4-deoxy-L-arabinose transferase [Marmoricola sp.]